MSQSTTNRAPRNLLITGGAGFIGSHLVEHWVQTYSEDRVVVLDKLTYAGDPANLATCQGLGNWTLVQGDIGDAALVRSLFANYALTGFCTWPPRAMWTGPLPTPWTLYRPMWLER